MQTLTRLLFICLALSLLTAASGEDKDAKEESEHTLKEVMEFLAAAHQEIQIGLLSNNRLLIAHGARSIAEHPKPKGGIKPYLTDERKKSMDTVKAMDKKVHDTAVEIAKEAATAEMTALQELNDQMTTGCIRCHNVFRDN